MYRWKKKKGENPPTKFQHTQCTKSKLYFIIQNWIIKLDKISVITAYKVHQVHQNNFNTSDDGCVGQNMLWKIGQIKLN
jgi:hypothetical protein